MASENRGEPTTPVPRMWRWQVQPGINTPTLMSPGCFYCGSASVRARCAPAPLGRRCLRSRVVGCSLMSSPDPSARRRRPSRRHGAPRTRVPSRRRPFCTRPGVRLCNPNSPVARRILRLEHVVELHHVQGIRSAIRCHAMAGSGSSSRPASAPCGSPVLGGARPCRRRPTAQLPKSPLLAHCRYAGTLCARDGSACRTRKRMILRRCAC